MKTLILVSITHTEGPLDNTINPVFPQNFGDQPTINTDLITSAQHESSTQSLSRYC